MNLEEALKIRTGTRMIHDRYGRVVARGPVHSSEIWGDMVWIDTPESVFSPDLPYNAHIFRLEFEEFRS